MWGNPTLFHRTKSIEKNIDKDQSWQQLLIEKSKY